MKSLWFSKCKEDRDRAEVKTTLVAGAPALALLKSLLLDLKANKEYTQKKPDYSKSNWAYEQADFNGSLRSLQEVIDLITIEDSK